MEKMLIDSKQLAEMLSVSVKWVIKNRYRIAGAQKVGSMWRFNLQVIKTRLATGKDLIN